MKRILYKVILLLISISPISFAGSNGLFFNVSNQGNALAITTTIPNKIYPAAGIKILTAGPAIANPNIDCIPINNGFCLFPVSDTIQRTIAINGSTANFRIRLCLNGRGPLSCQDYNVAFTPSPPTPPASPCASAGGVMVAGDPTHSCWINQAVTGSPVTCSEVCGAVDLTLQNPGPGSNVTLAGNVCRAFGFTGNPNFTQMNDIIYSTGGESCDWGTTLGGNWNISFANTGFRMCPCVNPG